MSTDALLAQIDDAIMDWEVGPDAVRYNAPEAARTRAPRLVPPTMVVNPARVTALFVSMRASMEQFAAAMSKAARDINAMVERNPALRRALGLPKPRYDEHHPRPLCIDGHAYHQRRRRR